MLDPPMFVRTHCLWCPLGTSFVRFFFFNFPVNSSEEIPRTGRERPLSMLMDVQPTRGSNEHFSLRSLNRERCFLAWSQTKCLASYNPPAAMFKQCFLLVRPSCVGSFRNARGSIEPAHREQLFPGTRSQTAVKATTVGTRGGRALFVASNWFVPTHRLGLAFRCFQGLLKP